VFFLSCLLLLGFACFCFLLGGEAGGRGLEAGDMSICGPRSNTYAHTRSAVHGISLHAVRGPPDRGFEDLVAFIGITPAGMAFIGITSYLYAGGGIWRNLPSGPARIGITPAGMAFVGITSFSFVGDGIRRPVGLRQHPADVVSAGWAACRCGGGSSGCPDASSSSDPGCQPIYPAATHGDSVRGL